MALAGGSKGSSSAADTATEAIGRAKKSAAGRRDNSGQEAAIDVEPLRKKLKALKKSYEEAQAASQKFNEDVKKVAEATGLLSAVVRKLIKSGADGRFEEERRKAEQLAMAFDEMAPEMAEAE